MTRPARPTPPRGTTRATGQGPADQIACPGCGATIPRTLIACKPCWRAVPGALKAQLSATMPGTIGRARVVGEMRVWLRSDPAQARIDELRAP